VHKKPAERSEAAAKEWKRVIGKSGAREENPKRTDSRRSICWAPGENVRKRES